MNLAELINYVGSENVAIQRLDEALLTANDKLGKPTKITFATKVVSTKELLAGTEKYHGLIIWLPKDKLPPADKL